MIIAIDGPAAAGKGTLARAIARELGFAYLDTGLIYRATGKALLMAGVNPEDTEAATRVAEALTPDALVAGGLRTEDVSAAASKVAAIPGVRAALLQFQRDFAARPPGDAEGAVLDGRDIGTVVCADAHVKLFVTASDAVRAQRRFEELQERGEPVIYADVFEEMKARDARDQSRATAPLEPASDALVIDTSDMAVEDVQAKALDVIRKSRT